MNTLNQLIVTAVTLISAAGYSSSRADSEPIQPLKKIKNLNQDKVTLGKQLFFDPRLSKSGFISCNSCHNLSLGGTDNLTSSIGHGWAKGPINSPTVLNAAYGIAQFWDGRAKDLKEQASGPIANPIEMALPHDVAVKIVASIPGYKTQFKKIYKNDKVTIDQVADSIAEFEKTLITTDSRFDKWLKGDDKAITKTELAGYNTFKAKGCVSCHNGALVGGTSFQKMGLIKPYKTKAIGRFAVTKNEADKYVFKVPTLRNVELTYPYFHDGSQWNLSDAVDKMADHQLGVKLTKKENQEIVAFLKTLTGKRLNFSIPVLPASTNHDLQSNLSH